MAGKKMDIAKEYREIVVAMTSQLDGGCEPDEFSLNQLRAAKKSLEICARQDKKSGKRKRLSDDGKLLRVNVAMAVWKQVLYRFCLPKQVEVQAFQRAFTMEGLKGFQKFIHEIQGVVFGCVDKEPRLTDEEKVTWKAEFDKPQGWIQNIAQDMKHHIWENLVNNLNANEVEALGLPATFSHKKTLLQSWSKELMLANREANVKYANKVVKLGGVHIEVAKGGSRPSRCIPNVRSIHFLRPEQIQNMKKAGGGVQGDVHTCHILDCPLIPQQTILVAKRFKTGDKHQRRADALQEVLMGGLNHRGIVGALAMTIQDPPKLIYDYYNGGDLRSFIDRCDVWRKMKGKSKDGIIDYKFIQEKKLFLENRLGIGMALLETMQYLHGEDRVHCDFHFGNILLHFDYEEGVPTKVYVGICDFGMSKQLSQCLLKEQHMWATPLDEAANYLKKFPQLAPELVGPNPAPYNKKTDVYSMGNIFETLFEENWDGMTKLNRYLSVGWSAQYNAKRLHDMISDMMNKNPAKRMDCGHWALQMSLAFPDCKLQRLNSPYLRD